MTATGSRSFKSIIDGLSAPSTSADIAPGELMRAVRYTGLNAAGYEDGYAPELIGGVDLDEAVESVMLDIAYSPVLVRYDESPSDCVMLQDGTYRVFRGDQVFDARSDVIRCLRARYILRKNELYRRLPSMEPEERKRVEALWFNGSAFVPAEGSLLRNVLETGSPATIELNGRDPMEVIKNLLEDAGAKDIKVVSLEQPPTPAPLPSAQPKPEPEISATPVELPGQGSRHLVAFDVPSLRRIGYGMLRKGEVQSSAIADAILKDLGRMLQAQQPTHAIFAFEGKGSVREQESAEYKAKRKPTPPQLVLAEKAVMEALERISAPVYAPAGYEADDVIAAVVKLCQGLSEEARMPVVIMSPDKDLGTLVTDPGEVMMWDGAKGGKVSAAIGAAQILAKWQVPPSRLGDLLALAGDDGDGIGGVPGWGPVKAAELLNGAAGKTLDQLLLAGWHYWVPAKFRKVFLANVERIKVCQSLVRLRAECLPSLGIEDLRIDALKLAEQLRKGT